MTKTVRRPVSITLAATGVIGGMLTLASAGAMAGECPPGQTGIDVINLVIK
jgi:hypothetical protein